MFETCHEDRSTSFFVLATSLLQVPLHLRLVLMCEANHALHKHTLPSRNACCGATTVVDSASNLKCTFLESTSQIAIVIFSVDACNYWSTPASHVPSLNCMLLNSWIQFCATNSTMQLNTARKTCGSFNSWLTSSVNLSNFKPCFSHDLVTPYFIVISRHVSSVTTTSLEMSTLMFSPCHLHR